MFTCRRTNIKLLCYRLTLSGYVSALHSIRNKDWTGTFCLQTAVASDSRSSGLHNVYRFRVFLKLCLCFRVLTHRFVSLVLQQLFRASCSYLESCVEFKA